MDIISGYIKAIRQDGNTAIVLNLYDQLYSDERLEELSNCLLVYPNVVKRAYIPSNKLTDTTGIKLAQYVAISSTIDVLNIENNHISPATYAAVAAALRVNSTLRMLYLRNHMSDEWVHTKILFIDALRLNPRRPRWSAWYLYESGREDLVSLAAVAKKSTSPSMLEFLLCIH